MRGLLKPLPLTICLHGGVPICHIDVLHTSTGSVDISLIRDQDNEEAPRRGLREKVQPLGENLVDTVEQAKGDDHATLEPTDTTPFESARALEGRRVPPDLCPHQQHRSHLIGSKI